MTFVAKADTLLTMRHIVCILFTAIALHSAYSQPRDPVVQLSRGHETGIGQVFPGIINVSTNILMISVLSGHAWGSRFFVDDKGRTMCYVETPLSIKGGWPGEVSTTNLTKLRSAIHELAATTNAVKTVAVGRATLESALSELAVTTNSVRRGELVMVSFRDGTNW